MTAVDAKTDEVVGTLALDAKPEFAVADGKGHVYVNLEDKGAIASIDPQHLTVISVWPLSGCEEPSGLALDAAGQRLIAGVRQQGHGGTRCRERQAARHRADRRRRGRGRVRSRFAASHSPPAEKAC